MNSHRRFRRVRSIVLVALSLVCVSAQAQLLNKLSSVLTDPVGTTLRVLANVSGIVTSPVGDLLVGTAQLAGTGLDNTVRSEEHTSELQSLMRNSYDVFCLKKK